MLYKLFSSLKTSIFILSFMSLIFLIGTIFPQGGEIDGYIEAGGRFVAVVRMLDFLDIFMSPLFIFVTGILVVNLAVCLYDRLKIFLKLNRKPLNFERLKKHPNIVIFEKNSPESHHSPLWKSRIDSIPRGTGGDFKGGEGGFNIEERLRRTGFTLKTESRDEGYPGVKIFEKGLQYWWLSWCYHVGIILAIFGFFITALFAFEKGVILYPDRPETISLYSEETRWNRFLGNIGRAFSEERKGDEYVLTLKEFKTEYYQGLRIDYPESKLERLALGIGIKKLKPSRKGFSYMPKMWLTRLDVKKPDGRVLDAELWVNRPFRTGSLTLYQMGFEQKAQLSVYPVGKKAPHVVSDRVNGEVIDVEARVPFHVKDRKGKFVIGSLKLGTLFKKDGTTEKINPVTTVYHIPETDPSGRDVLGELSLGSSLYAKGVVFEFNDYQEGSYLSYRKDPGTWLVGLACLFVFIGLFVRSFGAWYRVQVAVEDSTAYILISTRGILADRDRIIRKLQR